MDVGRYFLRVNRKDYRKNQMKNEQNVDFFVGEGRYSSIMIKSETKKSMQSMLPMDNLEHWLPQ